MPRTPSLPWWQTQFILRTPTPRIKKILDPRMQRNNIYLDFIYICKKKIVKLDDIELNSLAFIGKESVAIMYKKSFIDGACNNTRRIIKLVVTSAAV